MKNEIKFIEKEQDIQNETTRYWFSFAEENFCIADQNGELTLLDCDGMPIEDCNDHDGIKNILIPEYEKHILD